MHDPGKLQEKLMALSDAYAAQLPENLKNLQRRLTQLSLSVWDEQGFRILPPLGAWLDRLWQDLWVFIPQQRGARSGSISQATCADESCFEQGST